MKIVLFIAQLDISQDLGVAKKIFAQMQAFREMDYSTWCYCYKCGEIVLLDKNGQVARVIHKHIRVPFFRRALYWRLLRTALKVEDYDTYYIRCPLIDFEVVSSFKKISKNNGKIILEIPSFPFYKHRGIKRFRNVLNELCGRIASKYVIQILYIGNKTRSIFNHSVVQIPNGLPIGAVSCHDDNVPYEHGKTVRLVAVSSMYLAHGYDRILDSLVKYCKSERNQKIELSLIGNGPCLNQYKKIVKEGNIEDRVCFIDKCSGHDLEEEYEKSDLGLGAFGLYRDGYYSASILKIKEYLLMGLPFVYAGDEIGLSKDFPYALKVDNNSNEIDMNMIIDFANRMRTTDLTHRKREMQSYAIKNYSWKNIFVNAGIEDCSK